ncbi:unnamed protein product [Porites lobata]|uniref:Sulfotransferase domain-containing protein n=1 Tax=Porites lobata TaxID=104759 RepID=A0ABN8PUF8_9CNID|nr:unnamed protein product [Porites lobata]
MEDLNIFQEKEGEFTGPRHALMKNVRIPFYEPNIDKDFEKDLSRFETRPDDVYVVSYPKSGTTWLQEIVWQVYHNGEISKEGVESRYPQLEKSQLFERPGDESQVTLNSRPSPRLIKSHLPYHLIPMSENEANRSKYLYIARNPKDAAISFYHFVSSFGPASHFSGTWEFFAKLFIEGKGAFGFWPDHVLPWWEHRNEPHILLLKFEDLKKDLYSNVERISKFLGINLPEDVIARIAHQCTFSEMKKNAANFKVDNNPSKPSFLRKGEVGGWKSHFSEELNRQFDERLFSKIKGTGLEFEFGD